MRFSKLIILIVCLVVACFSMCSLSRHKKADLVIANGPDPRSLDPAAVTALADGRILSALFEGLLELDPETLAVTPAMAESLPVLSADGLTYAFTLRDGLTWSDGVAIDSYGLRWSFLRFLDPRTGARFTDPLLNVRGAKAFNKSGGDSLASEVGIRCEGPKILIFELESPLPSFPSLLTLFPLYPVPKHVVEVVGDAWTQKAHMVSNGPFVLKEWRLRDRVRVAKNPRYRLADHVKLQSIDYLCVESPATMLNLLVADRADIIVDVPTSAVPAINSQLVPQTGAQWFPQLRIGTYYFAINLGRPPLDQVLVRRALSRAIDREAITRSLLRAGELPATTFVPPGVACGTIDYRPPIDVIGTWETPERLLQAGLSLAGLEKSDFKLELIYSTSEANDQPIAELVQEAWSQLGLQVRLVNLDSGSVRDTIRRGQFQVARASWIGDYNDPSTFLDLLVSNGARNPGGWSDVRYDSIVLEDARKSRDDDVRADLYRAAESILMDQAVIIPIHHYVSRSLVRSDVGGFFPNIMDWHPPRGLFRTEVHR
jgi:oligopeptide transport system substrate-binding protein